MGWTEDPKAGDRPKKIVDWLNSHPGYNALWDQWKATDPMYARRLPGGEREGDWAGLLDGFGGHWDRTYGRAPGAPHEGSVQKFFDDIEAKSYAAPTGGGGAGTYSPWPSRPGVERRPGEPRPPGLGTTTPAAPGAGTPSSPAAGANPWTDFLSGGGANVPGGRDLAFWSPAVARGRQRYQDWLSEVGGLPEPEGPGGLGFEEGLTGTWADKSKNILNYLLESTGARRFLSPYYIAQLQQRAPQAWALNTMMGAGQPGAQTGTFMSFLKNFLASGGRGAGVGAIPGGGIGTQVQGLLDTLNRASTAAPGTSLAGLSDFWRENPGILTTLLGTGLRGSYGDWARREMGRRSELLPTQAAAGNEADWIDFLLEGIPGAGYRYGAAPAW